MTTIAERVQPQNLDAEKAILGAILLDNRRLSDACEHLDASKFFRAGHRRVFDAMVGLAERREAIDFLTLRDALTKAGTLDEVGGPAYLTALTDGVPRGVNVLDYARIVAEKAALRDLIIAGNQLVAKAYEASDDAERVLEDAERVILGLADRKAAVGFESMKAIAPRALEFLERMHQTRGGVSGVPSGFTDLDNLTRGFQPGTLVVVGGRPGMGKTALALNASINAGRAGYKVGFFSLEMPNEELFIRQIAAVAGIDSHRLQSGYIGDREWARVAEAIGVIAETPIFSDETPAIGIFQLRSRARRLKAEYGLDLLVLDYLQLMSTPETKESYTLKIGMITGAMKSFAKELKIPILLLSQLSRDHDKKGERPRLSDLKYSGDIEQDADIVMFLYHKDDPEALPNGGTLTELIVAKHRNGPTGTIKLSWFEQVTRFDDYSDLAQPEDQRLPMGERS